MVIHRYLWLKYVEAAGIEPIGAPAVQVQSLVLARSLLIRLMQAVNEIVEGRVSPLELLEVDVQSLLDGVDSDHVKELLEKRGPLPVGYAIE